MDIIVEPPKWSRRSKYDLSCVELNLDEKYYLGWLILTKQKSYVDLFEKFNLKRQALLKYKKFANGEVILHAKVGRPALVDEEALNAMKNKLDNLKCQERAAFFDELFIEAINATRKVEGLGDSQAVMGSDRSKGRYKQKIGARRGKAEVVSKVRMEAANMVTFAAINGAMQETVCDALNLNIDATQYKIDSETDKVEVTYTTKPTNGPLGKTHAVVQNVDGTGPRINLTLDPLKKRSKKD